MRPRRQRRQQAIPIARLSPAPPRNPAQDPIRTPLRRVSLPRTPSRTELRRVTLPRTPSHARLALCTSDSCWALHPFCHRPRSNVVASLREPPFDSVILDRPAPADVRSISLALSGTFVLRCASYAAGLLVAISLGLKSRNEADVSVFHASLVARNVLRLRADRRAALRRVV